MKNLFLVVLLLSANLAHAEATTPSASKLRTCTFMRHEALPCLADSIGGKNLVMEMLMRNAEGIQMVKEKLINRTNMVASQAVLLVNGNPYGSTFQYEMVLSVMPQRDILKYYLWSVVSDNSKKDAPESFTNDLVQISDTCGGMDADDNQIIECAHKSINH